MNNTVRFDLIKLNRDKRKLCTCKNNHYEIDTQNSLVYCLDCGAVVDPYEALYKISHMAERLENQLSALIEAVKENQDKLCQMKVFRDIEDSYRYQDLLPICPKCGEPFDPTKIRRFLNRKWAKPDREENHD